MANDEHDDTGKRKRKDKEEKAPPAPKLPITPAPKSLPLFAFLGDLFERPEQAPDRVALVVCHGAGGMRIGHCVSEWPITPRTAPGKEQTIELCNLILQLAQQDCDALDKPTRYAVLAYDLARSDRPIGRHLLRLRPSGMATALDDERGIGVEDEENNVLSTKLLLGLLSSSERDRRWMMEQTQNLIAGVIERQDERIDRMEQIVDKGWEKQVAMMSATEKMLSEAAQRQYQADHQRWKHEKMDLLFDKGTAMLSWLAPQLAARALGGAAAVPGAAPAATGEPNPVRKFMTSIGQEEGAIAFGEPDESGNATGGIFTVEQFQALVAIANAAEPDDEAIAQLAASITPAQQAQAVQLIGMGRLAPLIAWFAERQASAATVQQ